MLTRKQKVIAIAKDVLKILRKIRVETGVYLVVPDLQTDKYGGQLQNHFNKIKVLGDCQVCALGACFVSYVRLFNQVEVDDKIGLNLYYSDISRVLKKVFSQSQLGLIENAFEGQHLNTLKFSYDYKGFYNSYPNKVSRLKAIMRNIIRNGKFVLPLVKENKHGNQEVG